MNPASADNARSVTSRPVQFDAKTIARFWSKVDKNGPVPTHRPELGPCWVWTGGYHPFGYGRFMTCRRGTPKHYPAHRFAFLLQTSLDPKVVMHKCDNPKCVRSDHLAAGTQSDNMRDCAAKGRNYKGGNHRIGESVNTARFTSAQVVALREDHARGSTYMALAKKYGVHHSSIQRIVQRKNWKHVP